MLDDIQINDVTKKSSEESVKYRTAGNKQFFASPKHNKKEHLEILSLYNQSVAYAENDSEELALALQDRSVLWMHLQMHTEFLNDLQKSYEITKSEDLKTKLLTRKMKFLSLMDKSNKNQKLNNVQDNEPIIKNLSKTIPCAADCISITYDKKYGRCVMATKDIKPGTIISIEKGFALFPKREKTYTNCSHCLMLACNGVPCNSCAALIFCSEKCKEEAWLQYHDLECLILPYLRYVDTRNENLTNFLYTVRLFFKLVKKEGLENIVLKTRKIRMNKAKDDFLSGFFKDGIFQSDKFSSFYNLSHNVNTALLRRDKIYHYAIIKKIINFLAEKTDIFKNYNEIVNDNDKSSFDFIVQVLFEFYQITWINNYNFSESACYCEHPMYCQSTCGDQNIGVFIGSFSSLFNHSCNQNTFTLFTNKQEMGVVAWQFIKKGDQIFANYGAQFHMSKKLRQDILMRDYNFTCECELCKNNFFIDYNVLRNPRNISNLKALFDRASINKKSLEVFNKSVYDIPLDETTIKDVIKMCQVIEKNYNSNFAFICLTNLKRYICIYFDNLFSVRIFNIPNSC